MDNSEKEKQFEQALGLKKIPILVLDQKWHRLFAIHGKTDEIKALEAELNGYLARQGKLNNELKDLKKKKNKLMESVVENMEEGNSRRAAEMEATKEQINQIKQKMEDDEDELIELPKLIAGTNRNLMLLSMSYYYEKLKINARESREIQEWIDEIRVELKKNIIRKQNRDINNREIYSYLHDIFGPDVLDLFDIKYEEEQEEEEAGEKDEKEKEDSKEAAKTTEE